MKTKEKENPFQLRNCSDCIYLKAYVTWWCTNKKAIEIRGTQIPPCIHCTEWQPNWGYIDKQYKTEEYGYQLTKKMAHLDEMFSKPKTLNQRKWDIIHNIQHYYYSIIKKIFPKYYENL